MNRQWRVLGVGACIGRIGAGDEQGGEREGLGRGGV